MSRVDAYYQIYKNAPGARKVGVKQAGGGALEEWTEENALGHLWWSLRRGGVDSVREFRCGIRMNR